MTRTRKTAGLDQLGPVKHGGGRGVRSSKFGKHKSNSLKQRVDISTSHRKAKVTLSKVKFLED